MPSASCPEPTLVWRKESTSNGRELEFVIINGLNDVERMQWIALEIDESLDIDDFQWIVSVLSENDRIEGWEWGIEDILLGLHFNWDIDIAMAES